MGSVFPSASRNRPWIGTIAKVADEQLIPLGVDSMVRVELLVATAHHASVDSC